jgi:hypothetical protein
MTILEAVTPWRGHCPLTISEYSEESIKGGRRSIRGSGNTYWLSHESASMMRIPTFSTALPRPDELRRGVWHGGIVMTYLREPDQHHPANANLYLCRRAEYNPEELSRSARRDIRRAQRNLQFGELDGPTLLTHGWQAYSDTRGRVGLSDGTQKQFTRRFTAFCQNRAHRVFGAWKGNVLLAFVTLIEVDDWLEIYGSFSANADLGLCPNDGLANHVLESFLIRGGTQVVSYGTSSIQLDGTRQGLHVYKKKVGFEAIPVHRAFVVHPLFRPFANHLSLWALQRVLRVSPKMRGLKKACGALAQILGEGETARAGNGSVT